MNDFNAGTAAAGGGPPTLNSQRSTGSVAVSVAGSILEQNDINIDDNKELNIDEQANVVAASVQAIDAAIEEVETSRQWQEIVALIKVYGGWAGAALAVAINAYLVTNKGTIQELIALLPGMLFRILSDPAIPGNAAYVVGTAVKATAAIVFMRALISYLSANANSNSVFDDVKTANAAFLSAMETINPSIDEGGIAPEVLAKLRSNQLNFTRWNVTGKTKIIVDTAFNPSAWITAKETIGRLCKVPFTYVSEAGTVLATYAIGAVGNLQDYVKNRGDLLSLASDSTVSSRRSLWDLLLKDDADSAAVEEPVAGGAPTEKQVQLLEGTPTPIQATVLQVVLPQEEGFVVQVEAEINNEIGVALAGGGAGGGLDVPSVLEFRDRRSPSMFSDFTDTQSSSLVPIDYATEGVEGAVSNKQKRVEGVNSQPFPSDFAASAKDRRIKENAETGKHGPWHPAVEGSFSQPKPGSGSGSGSGFGGKKRKTRKTKKAKRTKKRSKKSSKRKTRR